MNKKAVLIILAVIAVGALGYAYQAKAPVDQSAVENGVLNPLHISQEVSSGTAVLLDVRTDYELQQDGYAAGSTHFDIAKLQDNQLPDISKDTKIYTYCKSGVRAEKAKAALEENGYTNVENIGGLSDWEAAGGQVVK